MVRYKNSPTSNPSPNDNIRHIHVVSHGPMDDGQVADWNQTRRVLQNLDELLRIKTDTRNSRFISPTSELGTIPSWLDIKQHHAEIDDAERLRKGLSSAFGSDKSHCLCNVLKPLFRVWQMSGVFPITHNSEKCKLLYPKCSVPALVNYFWMCASIVLSLWLILNVTSILRTTNTGTDLYTFGMTSVSTLAFSSVAFMCGPHGAKAWVKAWSLLHNTVEELALPNFRRIKRTVYVVPLFVLQGAVMDLSTALFSYSRDTIVVEHLPVIGMSTVFLATFVPNLLCGSYTVILWIAAMNFSGLNDQVKEIMNECSSLTFSSVSGPGSRNHSKLQARISRLRDLHENLCEAVRCIEKGFGGQMLGIFCSTSLAFVTGVYGTIVVLNGLLTSKETENMTLTFSVRSIMAGMRILVVLLISEHLKNKATETGHILQSYDDTGIWNEDIKKQVDIFKRKIGQFPLKITCCDIFSLSTKTIAPAFGNIITYLLVLLQFKLTSKMS